MRHITRVLRMRQVHRHVAHYAVAVMAVAAVSSTTLLLGPDEDGQSADPGPWITEGSRP